MNIDLRNLTVSLLLGMLALPATARVQAEPPAQPGAQQLPPQASEQAEEARKKEEEKKKKKKQQDQREQQQEKQQQDQRVEQRLDAGQKQELERQRLEERQQDQRADERLQAKQEQQRVEQRTERRVTQQEQQARIARQQQQLALYRQNAALREQLAARNAQVLRQQNRIQHLRFQEQYWERLRLQQIELSQARYNYYNDPYYYTAPNYRYVRDGRYYMTNQYGIKALDKALQAGYNVGYRAGRADREDRWRYDYRSTFAYQDANYGFDGRYIPQDEYQHYFREGFQRGYDDGYTGRHKYGQKDSGPNDEWLIAGAVVAAILGYQLLKD